MGPASRDVGPGRLAKKPRYYYCFSSLSNRPREEGGGRGGVYTKVSERMALKDQRKMEFMRCP